HPSLPSPARFIESLNGPNVTRPGLFRITFFCIFIVHPVKHDKTQPKFFYLPKKKDPKRRRISHEVSRLLPLHF
ncbi:unnamed protein product, partial [Brassica rapa subsp. trilocularis]